MERRIVKILTCGLVALMTTGTAFYQTIGAQEYVAPPVSISKDKVKIDGKVFYSHIVLEKQTLFSISKAYNVSVDDIYRHNPSVKENGLRKNDIIIIPVVEAAAEKVEKTETPVETRQQEEQAPVQSQEKKHTVKWYEDLSSIASKYKVSEESIIKANGLKDRKLKNRQVIIIPESDTQYESSVPADTHEGVSETEAKDVQQDTEDSTELDQYSDTLFVIDYWNRFRKQTVNATLILPFKATGTTGNRNNLDFYSGVLLAAREFKENRTNLHLNVYDMAGGIAGIPSDILKDSDIIIGPVAPADIEQVAGIVNGACPIVSPLDQRAEKLTTRYRNLIQAPASQYAQFTDIARWLMNDCRGNDKVIVISEKEARQNDAGRVLRSIIDRSGIRYTAFAYSILEGRDIQTSLEGVMTQSGTNRVVIASESEAFVNDAVRNLNLTVHNKFDIELYAPAKIRTFETIEVENFHNTSLHASLSYYIDYEGSEPVKAFIKKYRAMFGAEPTQFAFQGYDIAKYFITMISEHPGNWMSYLTEAEGKTTSLQSSFDFQQNENGGYVNNGIRRIEYNKDYSIGEWSDMK